MLKKHVTIEWLRELIRKGDTTPFYNTKEWHLLRERKRKAEHYECERCRMRGKHSQATTCHHKKYLRTHPEFALCYDNLELLCDECHYDEHHHKEQFNEERW